MADQGLVARSNQQSLRRYEEDEDDDESEYEEEIIGSRSGLIVGIVICVGLLAAAAIVLGITLSGDDANPSTRDVEIEPSQMPTATPSFRPSTARPTNPTFPPTFAPTNVPTFPPTFYPTVPEAAGIVGELSVEENKRRVTLGTPQFEAFKWFLSDYRNGTNADRSIQQHLQRYVLATFYYSTNGMVSPYTNSSYVWKNSTGWLNVTVDECTWFGITCDGTKNVTDIRLPNNRLSGQLPPELRILKLKALNLNSNSLSMVGVQTDVLGTYKQLEVLRIKDNYIEYPGIPVSLRLLQELVAVEIGLNLLSGPINNNVFRNKEKLIFFDAGSNFLTGDFPKAINSLQNIEQLRFQFNPLRSGLNLISREKVVSQLRVLWLDEINIVANFPGRFGQFVGLESLSLPGTGMKGNVPTGLGGLTKLSELWLQKNELVGKVPTQLGSLTQLKTFEFYNNSLTGVVPESLCGFIKVLTADCGTSTLSCSCCTKCFND